MRKVLFLLVLVLLVLPVVALAQEAAPVFSADPIGYLEWYWPKVLTILGTLFAIARLIIAYVPTPAPDATGFWPVLYRIITHVSLPTPQTATPAGRLAAAPPPPPAQPPPAQ